MTEGLGLLIDTSNHRQRAAVAAAAASVLGESLVNVILLVFGQKPQSTMMYDSCGTTLIRDCSMIVRQGLCRKLEVSA